MAFSTTATTQGSARLEQIAPETHRAVFTLPDNTCLQARLCRSARARRLRLSMSGDGLLRLTAPRGWSLSSIAQALPQFLPWLMKARARYQSHQPLATLPDHIFLPLLDTDFSVVSCGEYALGRRSPQAREAISLQEGARRILLLEQADRLELYGLELSDPQPSVPKPHAPAKYGQDGPACGPQTCGAAPCGSESCERKSSGLQGHAPADSRKGKEAAPWNTGSASVPAQPTGAAACAAEESQGTADTAADWAANGPAGHGPDAGTDDTGPAPLACPLAAAALQQWCRRVATRALPPFLMDLARQHAFPLEAVGVRDQRSRWGSCSRPRSTGPSGQGSRQSGPAQRTEDALSRQPGRDLLTRLRHKAQRLLCPADRSGAQDPACLAGRIQLNWRAILLPLPLLEHLCWHELCHLRHMDHSAAYRAELARFSPHWAQREKELDAFWRALPWWALSCR